MLMFAYVQLYVLARGRKFDMTKGDPNSNMFLFIESSFCGCSAHISINDVFLHISVISNE